MGRSKVSHKEVPASSERDSTGTPAGYVRVGEETGGTTQTGPERTDQNVSYRCRIKRNHWARGGEYGTIEAIDGEFAIVKFDKVGIGWDSGWRLRVSEHDYTIMS